MSENNNELIEKFVSDAMKPLNGVISYEIRIENTEDDGHIDFTVLIKNSTNEKEDGISMCIDADGGIGYWNGDDVALCGEAGFFRRLWLQSYITMVEV